MILFIVDMLLSFMYMYEYVSFNFDYIHFVSKIKSRYNVFLSFTPVLFLFLFVSDVSWSTG